MADIQAQLKGDMQAAAAVRKAVDNLTAAVNAANAAGLVVKLSASGCTCTVDISRPL